MADSDAAQQETTEAIEKKWWSADDDTLPLTQVNNDRPFLQRASTKAWEALATTLTNSPMFSRRGLDGKKAQNRFLLLMRQHKASNSRSAALSGEAEDETPRTMLLDDLSSLFNDVVPKKRATLSASEAAEKAANVKYIRDQAMQRGRRPSPSDGGDTVEPVVSSKRKMLQDAQESEIALESERLAFKRLKFEREMDEREKDRAERASARADRERERELERIERQELRDMENRRNEAMMLILKAFLDKSKV